MAAGATDDRALAVGDLDHALVFGNDEELRVGVEGTCLGIGVTYLDVQFRIACIPVSIVFEAIDRTSREPCVEAFGAAVGVVAVCLLKTHVVELYEPISPR